MEDTVAERDVGKVGASGATRRGSDAAKCVGEVWRASMGGARRVVEADHEIDDNQTTKCSSGDFKKVRISKRASSEQVRQRVSRS